MERTKKGRQVQQWRKRHRKKTRLYNYRSNTKVYVNKWASVKDLNQVIHWAQSRKQQLKTAKEQ